jgi:surface protein
MSIFKTTPDFAVRKTIGTFQATLTVTSGTAEWDYGDGRAIDITNTPNITYSAIIPYLINLVEVESNPYFGHITGIDLSNQSLTACDISRFENLAVLDVSDNSLRSEDIDTILITLDENGLTGGALDYSGNTSEGSTEEGRTAYDNLVAKGWGITGDKPLSSFIFTVKTDNTGVTANDVFRLPLKSWSGDFVLSYDGTSTAVSTTGTDTVDITFPSGAGTYDVKLTPDTTCGGNIDFNNGSGDGQDHEKFIGIKQWGRDIIWDTMVGCFQSCFNLVSMTATDAPDVSNVTSFANAFYFCDFPTMDVSNWDVSSATTISNMFRSNTALTSIIGFATWQLNTSPIVNVSLRETFSGCVQLIDLSGMDGWDMTRVIDIQSAFLNCSSLTTINPALWNLSNLTNANGMFSGCSSLTSLDVSNWDVSSLATFSSMFLGCSSITTLDTSNWTTTSATTFASTFRGSGITSIDISSFDFSNVTTASSMFYDCDGLTTIDSSSMQGSFSMGSMFYLCSNLTTITLPVSGLQPTYMNSMFRSCPVLATINNFNAIDTSLCTSLSSLFDQSDAITSVDMSNWDLSVCTTMSSFASNTNSITSIDMTGVTFRTAGVSFSSFAINASLLTTVIFPTTTFKPTTCFSSFQNCVLLDTITNFNSTDMSLCTETENMFQNCESLVTVDMSNFAFTTNDDFYRMFDSCDLLETVNMTGVTMGDSGVRWRNMFNNCPVLTEVTGLGSVDITGVDDMLTMFGNVTLDTANYDSILVGWEAQVEPTNINVNFGSSTYSAGAAATARNVLDTTSSWTIADGGPA